MKGARRVIVVVLLILLGGAASGAFLYRVPYDQQNRESFGAPPSKEHPLGTDELGRDRLARLLHGSRISLLLATAAALLATAIAGVVGAAAGHFGGWCARAFQVLVDLFLSLPWLFLLIMLRAILPLNVSPVVSLAITFALLGCLGWAGSARVIAAGVQSMHRSDFMLQARALGCRPSRLLLHVIPNLRPLLLAQLCISIPLFLLSEANLGLLGLGVAEPMPSWGNLLRELENFHAVSVNPWVLAPAVLLVTVVGCFHILLSGKESHA